MRTPVLFIGGEGRSGSTVLERLITAQPDTCAVGELKNLFELGVGGNELCGCGKLVVECELWSEVGDRLVGGWDSDAGRELVEFFTRLNRRTRLPVIVAGLGPDIRRARSILSVLYPMIAELTGATVIVDSSKHPSWAYLLAGVENIDLRVVQLVRHPSAVAYSWSRPVVRPHAAHGSARIMPAHSPVEVAVRWDVFNLLFHRLKRLSVPTVLVRYEDYVHDVDPTLRTCLALVGLDHRCLEPVRGASHGIAGNPVRFLEFGDRVVVDDRWIDGMSPARHALVSAITWPVRTGYGYRYDRAHPVGSLPVRPGR